MPITARWNPQQNLETIQHQLNRFLEPFTRMADEDLVSGSWVPPVDVAETQEKIVVRAEVPGMKQEDISIEFENGLLSIRGERKLVKEEGVTFHRVERTFGNFSRSFTLPRTIDPERIAAT
jgi:HSP20 family protein